jgi:hypothetical protein
MEGKGDTNTGSIILIIEQYAEANNASGFS